jgi:hypothetical protein
LLTMVPLNAAGLPHSLKWGQVMITARSETGAIRRAGCAVRSVSASRFVKRVI